MREIPNSNKNHKGKRNFNRSKPNSNSEPDSKRADKPTQSDDRKTKSTRLTKRYSPKSTDKEEQESNKRPLKRRSARTGQRDNPKTGSNQNVKPRTLEERQGNKEHKKTSRPEKFDRTKKAFSKSNSNAKKQVVTKEIWRLNRFIASSGVCSRREADNLIARGEIKVNGKVITEMGYKVKPNDKVTYQGRRLRKEKPVYLLLNKPKGFITTLKDERGRKTVMELVKEATEERIYPVGRLDRQTTGLLLFTNDGDVAKKLSHPSYEVQKIYKVQLDKPFTAEDVEKMKLGLELEDGLAKVDGVAILSPDALSVGVELHIGKNRIVRRMFAHLGYEVVRLDRTVFAGLTKETLGRGQWRFLTEREITRLRFFDKRK